VKSYDFALRVVRLSQYLIHERKEFVLSKQILRSGTAIGALIREAEFGQSKPDFISKMSISLKEANETHYWLNLLKDSEFLSQKEFESLEKNCLELIKLLVATVKTSKVSNEKLKTKN
jgi:four helix bundle protein